jgi:hypothetical protein
MTAIATGTFTVKGARVKKENVGQFGNNVIAADLTGADGETFEGVEFFQKPTTPLPADGDQVNGSLTQTEFGLNFKKAQMGGFSGGGGFKGGGGRTNPDERNSIERQVAYKGAVEILRVAVEKELVSLDQVGSSLEKLTEVGAKAIKGGGE